VNCTRFVRTIFAGTLLALVTCGNVAEAAFFNNTTGLASPESTVTFSEQSLTDGVGVTNQFAPQGVEFSFLIFDDNTYGGGGFTNISDEALFRPAAADGITPTVFTVSFTTALTGAAFAMVTNTGTGSNTFEALLAGAVVETGTRASDISAADNYYGFTGITFDAIRVSVDSSTNGWMVIDNVQLGSASHGGSGAVPEPATLVIWSVMAAIGLVTHHRRRRSALLVG
jgi:hypothetical protein